MKIFTERQLKAAIDYAFEDPKWPNVSVHLHFIVTPDAPQCFKRDVSKGLPIAHVFCQDKDFLVELARRSGIMKVSVELEGTPRQHVDFCGNPLKDLLREAGSDINDYRRKEH